MTLTAPSQNGQDYNEFAEKSEFLFSGEYLLSSRENDKKKKQTTKKRQYITGLFEFQQQVI